MPALADSLRRAAGLLDRAGSRAILSRMLLALVVLIGAWMLFHAGFTLSLPYPIEFREGASPVMTQFLLEGRNPFALENQPLGMNHYGIGYSAIAWPLAALFGNSLAVHRFVTFAFVVLTAALVSWMIFASNKHAAVAAACGLLSAMALVARGGLAAYPSTVGTFLFMAALIIPFRRSFDWTGLLCTTLLSIVVFYTKTYFVLGLGLVIAYTFLFVSKRRALLHFILSVATFLVSFFVIRRLFPLYFVDVVVSEYWDVGADSRYMWRQLANLFREFWPIATLGLLALLAAVAAGRSRLKQTIGLILRPDIRHLERPLIAVRMDYFGFASLGAALAFALILGTNTGQFMTYGYQVMLPPFLVWLGLQVQAQGRWLWIMAPALALNLISFGVVRLGPAFLEQRNSADWAQLYEVIDRSERILNSPVAAPEMIRQGKWPLDSGQSEYYYNVDARYAAFGGRLGPDYESVHEKGREYLQAIRLSVRRQEYDAIVLPLRFEISEEEVIRAGYTKTLDLALAMPQTQEYWPVSIWTPAGGK